MASDKDQDVPRSTGRVLDLLEIVLSQGTCNLTRAAEAAELTPTTALRHLRALEARGYLDRDDSGLFSPGPTLMRLAASLQARGDIEHLLTTAQPYLDALARVTGESTYLAVSDGRRANYVATAESDRSIRHVGGVGQVIVLEGTAVGGALETPGTVVVRTGAVEADISAVSVSPGSFGGLGIAVSIVGPSNRLVDGALADAISHAGLASSELAKALGIDTPGPSNKELVS